MKKVFVIILSLALLLSSCQTFMQQIQSILNGNTINQNDINNTINNTVNDVKNQVNNSLNYQINDFKSTQVRNITDALKKQLDQIKDSISNSYSVTDFNYAISFGDNATSYEDEKNFNNLVTYSYYLVDPTGTPLIQARNENTAGQMLYVAKFYDIAEYVLLESFNTYKQLGYQDSTEAILNMCNLGLLYLNMGKYGSSEEYLKMALTHRQTNSKDTVGYAATLNNLAVLYKTNGNFSEAEKYLLQAKDYIKSHNGENNIQNAIVLNNIAMLYLVINKLDQSEQNMLKSLDIAKNNVPEKSSTYDRLKVNLALIYKAKKDYASAEKIMLDALISTKKRLGTSNPDYATMLRGLASLYMEMEKYNQVEQLLKQALQIYKQNYGDQNPQYAATLYELGVYNQYVGKIDIAQVQFNQALSIQKQTLAEHHPAIAKTQEYLAINFWHKNDIKDAYENYRASLDEDIYIINNYFESMSDAEKALYWNQYQTSFTRFYDFVAQNYNEDPEMTQTAYNYYLQTKALLLNNSRKVRSSILESNNPQLISKFNQLNEMKNYIAKLYSFSNEELAERKINLDSLVNIAENLEKDVISMSSDYRKNKEQKIITVSDIVTNLTTKEAAMEIIRLNNYNYEKQTDSVVYMFMILKNGQKFPQIVVKNNGKSMETTYFEQYKKAIMNGKSMDEYYNYYWKEVDAQLTNVNTIYLSVDGIFNRINVNTFLMPDGKYVIDNFFVYNLTNSKDVISLKQRKLTNSNLKGKTAVLIGYPNYSMNMPQGYTYIPALPGTKVEIENIADVMKQNGWQIKEYEQNQATESILKSIKDPFVLHIATHGYFIEANTESGQETRTFGVDNQRAVNNPLLRSGLLFAGADKTVLNINDRDNTEIDDGVLNAYEAMTMQLDKTQLVVLSACQTGLGVIQSGEGVYGLQRAFQIAGAKTIITSLWPVSDEGTQQLMSNFYKNWLTTGDEFAAFRQASLYIKDKLKYPFYWGAFEIVGK